MKHIIEDFIPQGGAHCITNALKQILAYEGYPLSEEMIFGLGSGLSFLYLNQAASPMINGRTKVFAFEKTLAERLHIKIGCKAGKQYAQTLAATKQLIHANHPILIYADMPYLRYLHLASNAHFGGHAVVLFGYDDEQQIFYVSDRDQQDHPIRTPAGDIASDAHLVSYQEIEQARCSTHRPFPANQKYLTFSFDGYQEVNQGMLQEAILETCHAMLHPPAQLLGVQGILKFSKEVLTWRRFSPQKLSLAGLTNYFQIHADGGTGGGIFRRLYGDFLKEAAVITGWIQLVELGQRFVEVSLLWDEVAGQLWQLSIDQDVQMLQAISTAVFQLYEIEQQLYLQLEQSMQQE